MADTPEPCGVVGVLIDPTGYVWAEATDFSKSGYGGFTLKRAQEIRVSDALARNFIRSACADAILKAMDNYDCKKIVQNLTREHGWKERLISVGHSEDES